MGNWYQVVKKIRGRSYLYRQRSWREGTKVRTECHCLGPMADSSGSSGADKPAAKRTGKAGSPHSAQAEEPIIIGNPFESNTTKILRKYGIEPRFTEEPDYLKQWNAKKAAYDAIHDPAGSGDDIEVGKLPINWPKEPPVRSEHRNTASKKKVKMPEGVVFTGSFGDRKISPLPLAKEFEKLIHKLEVLGVDWQDMPTIRIERGGKPGWRKAWLSRRTYIITLPEEGGRTKFKQAYREALAQAFLEEVRRQDKTRYRALMQAAGSGYRRGEQVRKALAKIIHVGSDKAVDVFTNKLTKSGDVFREGDVGTRLLNTLNGYGCRW